MIIMDYYDSVNYLLFYLFVLFINCNIILDILIIGMYYYRDLYLLLLYYCIYL